MALDTLRAAVWPPSDVPLDRAGRRLPRWRDRPVCVEFHYRRRDWWFRPGVAAVWYVPLTVYRLIVG